MAKVYERRVPIPTKPNKFIHRLRAFSRTQNMSDASEKAYVYWTKRLIKHYGMLHPEKMNSTHIEEFLSYLVIQT